MSGIFLKSEFKDLFTNNEQSDNISVSRVLNKYTKSTNDINIASTTVNNNASEVNDNYLSATSSMVPDNNINLSVTSSMVHNEPQMKGGNNSANADKDNVDSLVAMLTSTESNTQTDQLETKLKGLLNNKVGGGDNSDLHNVKNFFHKLKSSGVKVDLKLDDLTFSEFFSSNKMKGGNVSAPVDDAVDSISTVEKPTHDDKVESNLVGGRDLPPALVAFQKLRSFVAKELDLKGIKVSAKVASALKKEVAEKNPKADPMELADLAIKYFKDNRDKYEKLAKSLA